MRDDTSTIGTSGPASQFRQVNAYWASVVFYKNVSWELVVDCFTWALGEL